MWLSGVGSFVLEGALPPLFASISYAKNYNHCSV